MILPAKRGAERAADEASRGKHYGGPERRRKISVLLATNRVALGNTFSPLVEHYRALEIVNALTTGAAQLHRAIERRQPRILLLDKNLLDTLSTRSAQSIGATFPSLRVLLVCDHEDPDLLEQVVRNRFHGYVTTSTPPEICVKALFKLNRGELWLPRALLEEALFQMTQSPKLADLGTDVASKLSKREAQTVRLLCDGLTNRQIADALGIREDTVKKHLHKAYSKLGVNNRSQLIASCVILPRP